MRIAELEEKSLVSYSEIYILKSELEFSSYFSLPEIK
jgi:hypothetical protein